MATPSFQPRACHAASSLRQSAVARRMAAAAAALVFGAPQQAYVSPTFAKASVVQQPQAAAAAAAPLVTLRVDFEPPTPPSSGVLALAPSACPAGVGGLPASECAWFEAQCSSDGLWRNASGVALTPDGRALLLSVDCAGSAAPVNATRGFWAP